MNNLVRVELIPHMVPLDTDAKARRAEAVERLGDMGNIDPAAGEIAEHMQQGWLARINGTEVPAQAYALESGDGSDIMLSLLIPVDSLSIGDPSLGAQAPSPRPAVPNPQDRPMWGSQTLGAQVATHAAQVLR